ncbi:hypothetical protein LZ198_03780 [Myxococcus sp. K15C18031901]|uniref:hypothetical protein n=1 Tax=Myxococcus dinghuensis TaxID=2906761 RepID=UPI0020A7C9E6|nr:hypothetical protein [Myxococcus dinghuensis]MCP3097993.1 hypothetical protein [Myxococcus dinghuensis]
MPHPIPVRDVPSPTGRPRSAHPGSGGLVTLALLTLVASAGCAHSAATSSNPDTTDPTMDTFVILFRQNPHPLSEADKALRQAEVATWARAQNAAGHALEPRILAPDVARPGGQSRVDDGAWPVTALLFLQARSLEEAAQVAGSHPATRFGSEIEVRPWAPPAAPAPR